MDLVPGQARPSLSLPDSWEEGVVSSMKARVPRAGQLSIRDASTEAGTHGRGLRSSLLGPGSACPVGRVFGVSDQATFPPFPGPPCCWLPAPSTASTASPPHSRTGRLAVHTFRERKRQTPRCWSRMSMVLAEEGPPAWGRTSEGGPVEGSSGEAGGARSHQPGARGKDARRDPATHILESSCELQCALWSVRGQKRRQRDQTGQHSRLAGNNGWGCGRRLRTG